MYKYKEDYMVVISEEKAEETVEETVTVSQSVVPMMCCGKDPSEVKVGQRVHDQTWDSKNNKPKRVYTMPICRDCVWTYYNNCKESVAK